MKALVIVDMQNDFVSGVLGSADAQNIVPKIVDKLHSMDGENTLVILTKDTHTKEYLNTQEGRNLPVEHCIYMTPGWSICDEISNAVDSGNFLTYHSNDIVKSRINKETFGSVRLGEILREYKDSLEEIIFVGVCTDICVISNALLTKAFVPEVKITVDASCCAGTSIENHQNALSAMKQCQINIINA